MSSAPTVPREANHLRGHAIEWDGERWVYVDTGEPTTAGWTVRPCGHCGLPNTPEGHDGCLGTLPGVMNACCGHGDEGSVYIQWPGGSTTDGKEAVRAIHQLRQLRACTKEVGG